MKVQLSLLGVCLVLMCSVVSAATSAQQEEFESRKTNREASSEQDDLTEFLGTLDSDIFDPTKSGESFFDLLPYSLLTHARNI